MRTMKIRHVNSSFDELLKLLEMNYQSTCEPEVGCYGQCNRIWRYLLTRPHVFVTALSWKSFCECVDAISPTLSSLPSEIYIPFLYHHSIHRMRYRLISMVCFGRQHYQCFAYNHEHERWILFDDTIVKEIGLWDDVVSACEEGLLQPHILFFEVVE